MDDPTYRAYAEPGEFVTTGGARVTDPRTLAAQVGPHACDQLSIWSMSTSGWGSSHHGL